MNKKYQIWECKIVVSGNEIIPMGFDFPPRRGAIRAIENNNIKVLSCFSRWGGKLTAAEEKIVDRDNRFKNKND